ncbi:MAG: bifunctional oligoribonuclease/PAP phosphatase NrnA [Bacilli bacterium]
MNFLLEEITKNKEKYDYILSKIKEYKKICVFRHIVPDYDALGTQFGLSTFLKDNFKDKEIYEMGDNSPSFTNTLFPPTSKLKDDFFNEKFLSIIVDVSDKKRIADPRFNRTKDVIVIDHHPKSDNVSSYEIIETDKAAASEIVTSMLLYFETQGYILSNKASEYLFIGLVGDSGRFLYNSTTPGTFEIAAELENKGLNLTKIYEKMYRKDIKDLNFVKFVLDNYKISKYGVCYYVLTNMDLINLGLTSDQGKELVNFFSNYDGINIWCSITEDVTEPCFRISLRSRNLVVSEVAKKFEGGGHDQAAGCQIKDLTELPKLIDALDDVVKKG